MCLTRLEVGVCNMRPLCKTSEHITTVPVRGRAQPPLIWRQGRRKTPPYQHRMSLSLCLQISKRAKSRSSLMRRAAACSAQSCLHESGGARSPPLVSSRFIATTHVTPRGHVSKTCTKPDLRSVDRESTSTSTNPSNTQRSNLHTGRLVCASRFPVH